MQSILVYADSLSWGIIPNTRQRLAFDARWPGVLEQRLIAQGQSVRVIENCLNGRRTVFEDPFKAGRNGLEGLATSIEMHSPLRLVILMLGSNDFQSMHPHHAWHAAQGMQRLIRTIRSAPIEPGMPMPPILVVAPPVIKHPCGTMQDKFKGAAEKSQGLVAALQKVCIEEACAFFDANQVVSCSPLDGIHLDASAHLQLGEALAQWWVTSRL